MALQQHIVIDDAKKPRTIGEAEAKNLGVWIEHTEMPNGERRFRLKHADGTAYIRTEATDKSGWQKSHFHKSVRETYIIQVGKVALAEWINEQLRVRLFCTDELFTTERHVPHNIYMFPNAIIHTVKHGTEGKVIDWHATPFLDEKTRCLSEEDIERLAGK
ncbi:MAG TPA: hypothetical protein VFB31_16600 [Pseudolabrys sp.]|nr:hypothetical protein [Pseudolabrys sp.]